jgi:DNA-binding Lrp family transcriptional regulator
MMVNCRVSYRSLAKKVGLSSNAVKYRIEKLVKTGVIIRFSIALTREMTDIDDVFSLVITDGTEDSEEFVLRLGENPMVYHVSTLLCPEGGAYLVVSQCSDDALQVELGALLRGIDEVRKVEMHRLLWMARGSKIEFSKQQLRVLRCLNQDARMKIEEIAKRTGMASKTVRRILRELEPGRGVYYACRLDFSAGGLVDAWVRISWDEKRISVDELVHWLRDEFPDDLWWVWVSTTDSIIFADFILDSVLDIEQISRRIRKAPFVKSTSALAACAGANFEKMSEIILKEMLENADV